MTKYTGRGLLVLDDIITTLFYVIKQKFKNELNKENIPVIDSSEKWLKNLYMIKDILAGKKINENEVNKIKIDFDFPEWLQNDKLPFANFKKTSTYNLKLDVKKINYIRTEIDTITLVSGDKQRGFARYMERRSSESNFFKKEFQKIA